MTPNRIGRALSKRLARAGKYLRARRHQDQHSPRTPVFVVGCQRSGTNMLLEVLDRTPAVWVYEEGWKPAFVGYRLAPQEVLERLIRRSPCPLVAFKPICDSHLTDRLLAHNPRGKAIWIYRGYADVANSAVQNWGEHQRDIMRWIGAGDWERLDWRGERLDPETVALIGRLAGNGLSVEEGAALFWYLRNRFYFELGLETEPRVLLVKYEDLVEQPVDGFARIFDFIGCRAGGEATSRVFRSSVHKEPFPEIAPEIRERCKELLEQLDRRYEAQLEGPSAPAPSGAS